MRYGVILAALAGAACAGEYNQPVAIGVDNMPISTIGYLEMNGRFAGILNGLPQGDTVNATLTLMSSDSGSRIGGTAAVSGTINAGTRRYAIVQSGTFTATKDSGDDPALAVTLSWAGCPAATAHYAGKYTGRNQYFTVTGSFVILDAASCNVAYTIPTTVTLY